MARSTSNVTARSRPLRRVASDARDAGFGAGLAARVARLGAIATRATVRRGAVIFAIALCGLLSPIIGASPASAASSGEVLASLHASFSPDRLGASTTIGFSFEVHTDSGLAPPPLTGLDLHMPAGMSYLDTTLGLAICSKNTLEKQGTSGCSPNAKLGAGSAYVEVPFGSGAGRELPAITAWMGPPKNGNMVVLFYVDGKTPVYGQFIFNGEVLPQSGVFGSQLATEVPLVTSVPGGPDVAIVRAEASIGPNGLTYFHKVHGKRKKFSPIGIAVPEHCPKTGFPFSAQFSFENGATAEASTTVPCPKARTKK